MLGNPPADSGLIVRSGQSVPRSQTPFRCAAKISHVWRRGLIDGAWRVLLVRHHLARLASVLTPHACRIDNHLPGWNRAYRYPFCLDIPLR
jgi:hypothetical protein